MADFAYTNNKSKTSSPTFTVVNISSARALKENIQPTEINALDIINNVEVVDFNYIEDTNKDPKVGLIADDCPAILAARDRSAMDVNNCIGVLIKAVQELNLKVKELEKQIK